MPVGANKAFAKYLTFPEIDEETEALKNELWGYFFMEGLNPCDFWEWDEPFEHFMGRPDRVVGGIVDEAIL